MVRRQARPCALRRSRCRPRCSRLVDDWGRRRRNRGISPEIRRKRAPRVERRQRQQQLPEREAACFGRDRERSSGTRSRDVRGTERRDRRGQHVGDCRHRAVPATSSTRVISGTQGARCAAERLYQGFDLGLAGFRLRKRIVLTSAVCSARVLRAATRLTKAVFAARLPVLRTSASRSAMSAGAPAACRTRIACSSGGEARRSCRRDTCGMHRRAASGPLP